MKVNDYVKAHIHFRKESGPALVYNLVYLNDKTDVEASKALKISLEKVQHFIRFIDRRILEVQAKNPFAVVTTSVSPIGNVQVDNTPIAVSKVDMSGYIPIEDGYVPRKFGRTTDIKILEKAYKNHAIVLISGDTGTGKTACVNHFAYENGIPYARLSLNGGTTVEDLIGHWVPTTDKSYRWQDGILTTFVRNGGVVVADEVNACPPEILFSLHSLTDKAKTLTLTSKDGEVLRAHPNFFFVATMNPEYEGTRPLNAAFKDRFKIKLDFPYDAKIEADLIKDDNLLSLASKLRLMRNKGELVTPISTRTLLFFKENEVDFGRPLAIELFLNNFEPYEKEAIKNVIEMMAKNPSQDTTGDNDNGI